MSTAASKDAGTAPVGITPAPMPQYNGTLREAPNAPQVYLILNGLACWVPDATTLDNLFVPGANPLLDPNLNEIEQGNGLTSGAILAQGTGTSPVYLITNGVKMWIPTPDIFNAYMFNSKLIQFVDPILLDFIPNGPDVEGPSS